MSSWEAFARRAIAALELAALDGDVSGEAVDEALRRMREFRARAADVAGTDRDRFDAFAEMLDAGIKALRLVEKSRLVMKVTGEAAEGPHPASTGVLVGRAALQLVMRALAALGDGERDLIAENGVRQLSKEALLPAIGRISYLHKLALDQMLAPDDAHQRIE